MNSSNRKYIYKGFWHPQQESQIINRYFLFFNINSLQAIISSLLLHFISSSLHTFHDTTSNSNSNSTNQLNRHHAIPRCHRRLLRCCLSNPNWNWSLPRGSQSHWNRGRKEISWFYHLQWCREYNYNPYTRDDIDRKIVWFYLQLNCTCSCSDQVFGNLREWTQITLQDYLGCKN